MMAAIHPEFVSEIREEMDHDPINVLGRYEAVQMVHRGTKTYINGTETKGYCHQFQPSHILTEKMNRLLEKLGLKSRVMTGARAHIKIGGKTIAVAQNVSYGLGHKNNGIQTIPNGRLTLHRSDDEET